MVSYEVRDERSVISSKPWVENAVPSEGYRSILTSPLQQYSSSPNPNRRRRRLPLPNPTTSYKADR